jgi:hypothetical protein
MIERTPNVSWIHAQSPKTSILLDTALLETAVVQVKITGAVETTSFVKRAEAPQARVQGHDSSHHHQQPQPTSPLSEAPPPLMVNRCDAGISDGCQSTLPLPTQPHTIQLLPVLPDAKRRRVYHKRSNSMSNYVQTDKDGMRSIGGVQLPRSVPYVVPIPKRHFGQLRD